MFDSLKRWLFDIFDKTWYIIAEVWRQVANFFRTTWGVVLLVAGWVWTCLTYVVDSLGDVVNAVAGIVMPGLSAGGNLTNIFGICNYFLPLQEVFAYIVLYAALLAALTVYRVIKSWIPTLS